MWQSRASHSRATGLLLLLVSGIMLAVSYLTRYTLFEVVSIASFVLGVILIASELESKVKLVPSAASLVGPLLAFAQQLSDNGLNGKATYVPSREGVEMRIGSGSGGAMPVSLPPVGRGLFEAYERELGPLRERGASYIETWIPRVLVDGLGIVEDAKIKVGGDAVEVKFRGPFVRPLCVRRDINEKICGRVGCPLVSSMGESLAASLTKSVTHIGCTYDTPSQTSVARFSIVNED